MTNLLKILTAYYTYLKLYLVKISINFLFIFEKKLFYTNNFSIISHFNDKNSHTSNKYVTFCGRINTYSMVIFLNILIIFPILFSQYVPLCVCRCMYVCVFVRTCVGVWFILISINYIFIYLIDRKVKIMDIRKYLRD